MKLIYVTKKKEKNKALDIIKIFKLSWVLTTRVCLAFVIRYSSPSRGLQV